MNLKSENNFLDFKNKSCYVGKVGVKEKCRITKNGKEIIFQSISEKRKNGFLNIGEGMTIAAAFDKGQVLVIENYILDESFFWKKFWKEILGGILAFLSLVFWTLYK